MKARSALIAISGMLFAMAASAADDKAIDTLLRKSNCTKCHSVDKKKVGPAYKEVASKYNGNADAEQALYTHLTTSPTIDVDGTKEQHVGLKGASEEQTRAVVRWILSK